jgi:hypothetical protein
VAEVFTFADAEGRQLSDYCRLDTCVTVVDAFNFSRDYNSRASLADRGMAAHTGDERHVVDLLIDQVRAGMGLPGVDAARRGATLLLSPLLWLRMAAATERSRLRNESSASILVVLTPFIAGITHRAAPAVTCCCCRWNSPT